VLDSIALPPAGKAARYAQRLRALPAGLSQWAVHPGLDTAELRALFASGAGWEVRQTDLDFLVSPEARALVQAEGPILSDYRPLQARWRRTLGAAPDRPAAGTRAGEHRAGRARHPPPPPRTAGG